MTLLCAETTSRNWETCVESYWQPLAIEEHTDTLRGSSNVVGPPGHQSHRVFIQDGHFKLGKIWSEGDTSVLLSIKGPDCRLACPSHIVIPCLCKTSTVNLDFFPTLINMRTKPQILLRFHLTCLKVFFESLQAVSTVNLVLKMLQSLAPYPLRPPEVSVRRYGLGH